MCTLRCAPTICFTKMWNILFNRVKLCLIDEHTGRTMPGRRLSEGLHQAIEAKEGSGYPAREPDPGLHNLPELLPNLYRKLAGMTGTADTEAYEFHQIYGLQVVVIPTNVDVQAY